MTFYSQKDSRWKNAKLGNSNLNFYSYGCFVTSYANILEHYGRGLTPLEVNDVGKACGAFSGANLVAQKLSEALNLSYERVSEYNGGGVVIVETDHYKSQGVPQHFYLLDTSTGKMVDPLSLTPDWVKNKYNVVSYRIINNLNKMNKDFVKIIEKITDEKLGDNINGKEQKESAEKLEKFYEKLEILRKEITFLDDRIDELSVKVINQAEMIKAKDIQIEKLKAQTGDCESKTITQLLGVIINRIIKSNEN